jgi:hypothetical protein
MRLRSAVLTASIVVIAGVAAPAAAQAETWIGPGVEGMPTDPSYGTAGCQESYETCVLVQQDWTPSSAADGGAALPFPASGAFVITEFKIAEGLNNRSGLWVLRLTDPSTGYYKVLGTMLGRGADASDAVSDSPAFPQSLPIHQGDTLGVDIASEQGTVHLSDGDGHYAVARDDNQNTIGFETPTPGFAGTLEFMVRVEPDADGDGFGDETQDRCPGFPGVRDGCAQDGSGAPAPSPAPGPTPPGGTTGGGSAGGAPTVGGAVLPHVARLSALRLSGTKLSYTLTTRLTHVRAKLERRRSGRWHVYATRALTGAKGPHTARLPRHRKGDRLVITAAGKAIKIITLPR